VIGTRQWSVREVVLALKPGLDCHVALAGVGKRAEIHGLGPIFALKIHATVELLKHFSRALGRLVTQVLLDVLV
jgi:hypothetical protein